MEPGAKVFSALIWFWLILFSLPVFANTEPSTEQSKISYQLGVFAYKGVEQTLAEFEPVIQALNRGLETEQLELQILSQAEIYQGLENRTLDFVITNPTHFLVARQRFEVTGALATLVKNHQGLPLKALAGVIVVRADNSKINHLHDLKGRKIAAPGPEFMGGFRAQSYELYLAGVKLEKSQITYYGTHDETITAVLNQQADVGFVRDGIIEGLVQQGVIDAYQLKIIHAQYRPDFPHVISTRLYPEWPVFALPHVSDRAKRHITAAMLNLEYLDINTPDGGIYGFTVPSDYLGVEALSRALRIPPFEVREAITWQDLKNQYGAVIGWTLAFAFGLFIALISLLVSVRQSRAASLYSQQLLASQDELVLVNDGNELIDVSGGFLRFFNGYYASLKAFKQDYRCICDLFIEQPGYLYNYHAMEWLDKMLAEPSQQHKAIVGFQGVHTYFKCSAVYSKQLGLYLITMVDITELEITNQRLSEQTRLAEQANRTKSNFLANMSHEIRTPMNGILGLSELGQDEQDPAKLHQRLNKIHHSGSLLLGIINDILDLSKIEAGQFNLDPQPFAMVQLAEELVDLYQARASAKSIEFKLELDSQLALGYVGDDLRLRQVLANLITNAIKFTEQGAVTLRIGPDLQRTDNHQAWLNFEVQDTGKGISLEQQRRLFKPFSQADDSITREYGGTGLGLTISEKLVQLMGGEKILLHSELGQGSLFSFSLPFEHLTPLQQEALELGGRSSMADQVAGQQAVKFNAKVLLVEDNEINQEVATEHLKRLGIDYDIAANGEVAVSKAQNNRYDLILMDIQMPIMDGYQATQRIRQFNPDIPIIAQTAAAMIEDKAKALDAGMNDHISKPINQQTLIASLQHWIGGKQQPLDILNPSVLLLVHPDAQTLKRMAQGYQGQTRVRVANSIDKAENLLRNQPDIEQVLVASCWEELAFEWQNAYKVDIQTI
ncbi:PhnD/SsuA/transferrin family substrate-binding protein [Thiomicrospira microaerophila]|uniref:PhnD/SsuA/transferrin family substrate-binding protein n=1 Tax=Thiomicrospira microaerophila TaxID=406020 RepID=UPI00200D11C2|nr:PhnD/SsuA/transferrin family substrate-binding protein [Thiomicrospira microaerophila]UQB42811.1 PhnD/SsuA/transferrin family substrate-binding protein [Thiomicrospira microaerophila]